MSLKLLEECLKLLEKNGFDAEFQALFGTTFPQLLNSRNVGSDLVTRVMRAESSDDVVLQLMSVLLVEASAEIQDGGKLGTVFLAGVESAVERALSTGEMEPDGVMIFAVLYQSAGLPIPDAFKLDGDQLPMPLDMDGTLSDHLTELAREVRAAGGGAFDLFSGIEPMLATAPEEARAGIAHSMTTMADPIFERCALFMLLSGSEMVQAAVIAGLRELIDRAELSPQTLTLLPIIRGWFAGLPAQAGLDKVIEAARRKEVLGNATPVDCQISQIWASLTDGVGAQSIAILVKQETKTALAMVLTKEGFGVKDSYLVPTETEREAEFVIDQMREQTGAEQISPTTLTVLLEGALADGIENKQLPAPGFLEVVETCQLLELRPQVLDLNGLLRLADPDNKISDASSQALGRWIRHQDGLVGVSYLADSWFEESEEVDSILRKARTERSQETNLWKYLETRRDFWTRRFLQTAVILRDAELLAEWKTLTATAYGLMNGRSLKRTPVMEMILDSTLEAYDYREDMG